jgi:hypothetical protein
MNSRIFIASLVPILLIAGCTAPDVGLGGGNAVGGQGLEILSFGAEPTTVYSGTKVRLTMEVQNMGGTSVPGNKALVFLTGTNFGSWTGATAYNYFGSTEMKSNDVVRDVPANTKKFTWSATAPTLQAGQTETDTFIGRVYSEYETSANGNIWTYSESEAEAARTAGRSLYTPSFTYTRGPVGLSVSINPNPVILYTGDYSFTMNIRVSNQAQGTIYSPGSISYTGTSVKIDSTKMNHVTLSATSDTGVKIGTECTGDQELVGGKDTTLTCTVTVPTVDTFQSFSMKIKAAYGYYTERTTTVTVQGKSTTTGA